MKVFGGIFVASKHEPNFVNTDFRKLLQGKEVSYGIQSVYESGLIFEITAEIMAI